MFIHEWINCLKKIIWQVFFFVQINISLQIKVHPIYYIEFSSMRVREHYFSSLGASHRCLSLFWRKTFHLFVYLEQRKNFSVKYSGVNKKKIINSFWSILWYVNLYIFQFSHRVAGCLFFRWFFFFYYSSLLPIIRRVYSKELILRCHIRSIFI